MNFTDVVKIHSKWKDLAPPPKKLSLSERTYKQEQGGPQTKQRSCPGRVKSRMSSCPCFSLSWVLKAEENIAPPSRCPLPPRFPLQPTHAHSLTPAHTPCTHTHSCTCAHALICHTSMSKALPYFRKKEHGV